MRIALALAALMCACQTTTVAVDAPTDAARTQPRPDAARVPAAQGEGVIADARLPAPGQDAAAVADAARAVDASLRDTGRPTLPDAAVVADARIPAPDAAVREPNWSTMHGTRPAVALALPAFRAFANDGTARGPADLQGHPTVMWFFPFANTPG